MNEYMKFCKNMSRRFIEIPKDIQLDDFKILKVSTYVIAELLRNLQKKVRYC